MCGESVQGVPENKPKLLLDQATLPVGAEPKPETVALHVIVVPMTTEAWLHAAVRVEGGRLLTKTVTDPEVTDSDALSLTWSSKLQTPGVDRAPVETESGGEVSQLKELPKGL